MGPLYGAAFFIAIPKLPLIGLALGQGAALAGQAVGLRQLF